MNIKVLILIVLVVPILLLGYTIFPGRAPDTYRRWRTPQEIAYYINPAGSGLTLDEVRSAIEAGFQAWEPHTAGLTFRFAGYTDATGTTASFDGRNTIYWDENGPWPRNEKPFAAASPIDVDTYTGDIREMDIVFNTRIGTSLTVPEVCGGGNAFRLGGMPVIWNVLGKQGVGGLPFLGRFDADIQATATHEIGHFLGLGHSLVSGASMSTVHQTPTIYCSTIQRAISADDIAGAGALYPASPGSKWTRKVAATVPGKRLRHAMAYDAARQKVVMFGGFTFVPFRDYYQDTWIWDGVNWTNVTPPTFAPKPFFRGQHAMVYDPVRQEILLFGGTVDWAYFADTWVWNGISWQDVTPSGGNPAGRAGHAMAYDASRQKIVMYGGCNPSQCFDDTWEWDGGSRSWSLRSPITKPAMGLSPVMTFDPASNRMVMYTGGNTNPPSTWVWDGAKWTAQNPTLGLPSGLWEPAVTFDGTQNKPLFYGGLITSSNCLAPDNWYWNGTANPPTWERVSTTVNPGFLSGHAMTYDAARQQVVLFGGGLCGGALGNDTWVWGR